MSHQMYSIQQNNNEATNNEKVQSQIKMNSNLDKTYDDCNVSMIVASIVSKLFPIFIYLIFKFLTNLMLGLFIFVIILISIDFWISKNLLGPKLAGIRWFIKQNVQQESKWCFLGCSETRVLSQINTLFFWFPQIIAVVFWIIIFLINLATLSPFWAGLALFSCILIVINFVSFIQCKGDHQKTLNKITKRFGYQIYHDDQNTQNNK